MQRLRYMGCLVLLGSLAVDTLQAEDFLQSDREFDSYLEQSEQQFQQQHDEFQRYRQRLLQAFEDYRRKSARIWGKQHTLLPSATRWVSYQGDLRHRSVVDFESGNIRVELALEQQGEAADSEARRQLADSILQSLQQGGDRRSIIDMARQPVAEPEGPALLEGQLARPDGSPARQQDYASLARGAAASAGTSVIRGEDGRQRRVYRADLKLVPDHIRRRARLYQTEVNSQAVEHRIPASVVFAIMETESMFNPMARSPAPAFGLMQLVPGSGAREAYRYLYRQDRIVSDTYLYDPGNNIRLGTALLNRLYYKYLVDIDNPQARLWATIAAYNTGASNVLRSFAGEYSRARYASREQWKRAAFDTINRQSAEQVYQHLRKALPYKETRTYIQKVRSRMGKYSTSQGV